MTSQEKKEQLQKYKEAEREAVRLEEEIARWYSQAERTTTVLQKAPGGGTGGDRLQSAVEEIDGLLCQLGDKRAESVRIRRKIEDAIANVSDGRQRQLLRYRYIEGMTWTKTAVNLGVDERWVYRLHGQALSNLTIVSQC
jgi:DNA-directed RNA polymerase specialized sigma subunit